jgi:ATP-dependent helicase/nuclease subunit A
VRADAYRIDGMLASRGAFYALACDPARSVAVEACAGAGKTWMLVSRILRALLDGCPPQDILAITFTRKAAGEMRDRLDAELRRWTALSDEALCDELRARGLSENDAQRRVSDARGLHERVLAQGRPVQVRTFHGWFAALLRGAPLSVLQELQLPVQYELLEDDEKALAHVWPRFYAALAASPPDRQDFMDSVAQHGRHQTANALKKALQKRVEFALADAAGVVDRSVDTFAMRKPHLRGLERPELALMNANARARWLGWARALGSETNKTPKSSAAQVVQAFELSDVPELMPRRLALLRKAFLVAGEDRLNKNLVKFDAALAAEAELVELCEATLQHNAWLHHQRMARLSRVLLGSYADLKRERGWVDMNDVEGAARRLLGDAELSGWLQQRLDARVRHVLIDEFQDTNPLQWQTLYGWLSAYAGAGSGEAPCVFLVGDPKQSIYRFRRAEPQVFRAAQAFVVEGLAGALLSCDHTRRCAPAVVEALNEAMTAAAQAGEYGSDFRAHTTESTAEGAVLCLPQVPRSLRDRDDGSGDRDTWRDSLITPRVLPEDTMSALEARQAAEWVATELDSGRVAPEGIMVLSRRRERLAWMFEALRERGIASEQPEKLELGDAPPVQDVIALLDALVSTGHDLSLARALKSPLFLCSDDDLAQIARWRLQWTTANVTEGTRAIRPSWWSALQRFGAQSPEEQRALAQDEGQLLRLRDSAQRLALYGQWVNTLPPHDALSAIYDHGDVLARFAQAVPGSQRVAVLAQLRDLLGQSLAHEGGRFLTPYRLVRALKAGGIRATPVHTPGAVRLLTIHGAKGLEAHTVVMLDTDTGGSRPESMGVLVDWPGEEAVPRRFVFLASEKNPPACAAGALAIEQQARSLEELNALYVAITRAESRLVISSFEPHQRGQVLTWYQRLQPLACAENLAESLFSGVASEAPAKPAVLPGLPPLIVKPVEASPASPAIAAPLDDTANRFGLALHRLLQWRPTPAGNFAWSADHTQAVAREFDLDAAQAREAMDMAHRIVNGEAAWAWDTDQLDQWGNEVELFHQGTLWRLDRLVRRRSSGEWWVLDYKSAVHPERQPELLAQMQRYRAAMIDARPGEPVRLAFINAQGRLIELPAEPATG